MERSGTKPGPKATEVERDAVYGEMTGELLEFVKLCDAYRKEINRPYLRSSDYFYLLTERMGYLKNGMPRATKPCEGCGGDIHRNGENDYNWRQKKYCSRLCRRNQCYKSIPEDDRIKVCEVCLKEFGPKPGDYPRSWKRRKYCSLLCSRHKGNPPRVWEEWEIRKLVAKYPQFGSSIFGLDRTRSEIKREARRLKLRYAKRSLPRKDIPRADPRSVKSCAYAGCDVLLRPHLKEFLEKWEKRRFCSVQCWGLSRRRNGV